MTNRQTLAVMLAGASLFMLSPARADLNELMRMSEQLDKLEKQDFVSFIERANGCTRARNFACSSEQIGKAAKLVNGRRDTEMLASAKQNLANEQYRVAEEERRRREAEAREAEARQRELEEQRRLAEERIDQARREAESSSYNMSADIMGHIVKRSAENAALLRRIDRQTDVAVAETNRRLAEQAALRERDRIERELAEERRRQAERERAARYSAPPMRSPQPELPKYQPQVVVIPTGPTSCPPGSSPARHPNGQTIAVPAAAYCIKDSAPSGKAAAQSSGEGASENPASTRTPGAENATKLAKSETESPLPKTRRVEWGPLQKEAMAICHQSKRGTYRCDGPVQLELIGGAKTIEEALSGQECRGGTWIAGGPVIDGEQWQAYRCNHAIGAGDRDIAPRYGLVAMQRSFMCPKGTPGDGRCSTLYDGQDKR